MSLNLNDANYGGRQPDINQDIKQFFVGQLRQCCFVYKKINNLLVQTPANNKTPVYINNDLYVTGTINTPSDINLKENIVTLPQSKIDNLLNLKPVEYLLKSDLNKTHFGFIAQDVEKIYPELVKNGEVGFKTINYIELIPVLVSKIQDMQNEIDELKTKIK
jgi:hypothetical protein